MLLKKIKLVRVATVVSLHVRRSTENASLQEYHVQISALVLDVKITNQGN